MHIAIYFSMVRPSLKRKVSEISCKALKIMQQPQLQPKEPSSNAYLMKQLCQCCGAFINNLTTQSIYARPSQHMQGQPTLLAILAVPEDVEDEEDDTGEAMVVKEQVVEVETCTSVHIPLTSGINYLQKKKMKVIEGQQQSAAASASQSTNTNSCH